MGNSLKILHLTPHLGGGVGSVVRGYLEYEAKENKNFHRVVSLDSLNMESKELFNKIGIEWAEQGYWNQEFLSSLIIDADIVLIHWWNHPLLQDLLMNRELPQSRIVIWAHISGNSDPNNFSDFILNYPDKLVFTTPLSFASSNVRKNFDSLNTKLSYIWSTIGVEKLQNFRTRRSERERSDPLIIGYVGNLDYSKLHPSFFDICKAISDPNIEIQVIGPLTLQFKSDFEDFGQNRGLRVTGFIPDMDKFKLMSKFDIFLYPLARDHYGTCDQAIQEAMALGAVPVVLNNQMESYMIDDRRNGLVANDVDDLIAGIQELIADPKLRDYLGENAAVFARSKYKISEMANSWNTEFQALKNKPKQKHRTLSDILGRKLEANEVFTHSLGTSAGVFEMHRDALDSKEKLIWEKQITCLSASPKWSSPTKSSPSHFSQYFPNDPWLKMWSRLTTVKSRI
jgi:glycosyltransferase involved in cell wall biosynthesis